MIGLYIFMNILIAVCNITTRLLDRISGASNRKRILEMDNITSDYAAYSAKLEITSVKLQFNNSGYENEVLKKGKNI